MTTINKDLIENSGIMGTNDFKNGNEKAPDHKGRAKVGGLWYWVSGWTRAAPGKTPFDSLAFTLMTQDEADKAQAKAEARLAPQTGAGQQQQAQAQPQAQSQQAQQSNPNASAQNPDGTPHQSAQTPVDFDDDIPF